MTPALGCSTLMREIWEQLTLPPRGIAPIFPTSQESAQATKLGGILTEALKAVSLNIRMHPLDPRTEKLVFLPFSKSLNDKPREPFSLLLCLSD